MELNTTQFWAAFFSAVSLYYPEDVDPKLKPADVPQQDLFQEYTFIVVGAGAAGCVLANRLTENPKWTVLLIEAGVDEDAVSDTPIFETLNHNTIKDWNYTTVRQKKACLSRDGICTYPRGHAMGGSTTINGMMYVRGHKADFEEWEELGLKGWGYKDVLPYFIKMENNTEPMFSSSPYHGRNGPFNVQFPRYITPMREEYIKAGEEVGWKKMDYNAEYKSNIIDYVQFAMDGPSRESTSKAYLNPINHRSNLHVIKNSVVKKVIIEGMEARGVEYYRNGHIYQILAEKDVIVSAGAINTPKILMLSGIGPKEELEKHSIPIIADLPVGKNLQDHPLIPFTFELTNASTITSGDWKTEESIIEYAKYRRGPLTTTGGEAMSFFNPLRNHDPPSIQIMFHSVIQGLKTQPKSLISVVTVNVNPKSVGSVTLMSSDFKDPPKIDPNYFGDEEDYLMMCKGLEKLFEVMGSETMKKYSPMVYYEYQPKCRGMTGEELIHCMILQYSQTVYHPVGTARMGAEGDPAAVVGPDLAVRQVRKLRVIDASVMPRVTRGNTMAPTIMLAEKGADILKENYKDTSRPGLFGFIHKVPFFQSK